MISPEVGDTLAEVEVESDANRSNDFSCDISTRVDDNFGFGGGRYRQTHT